jgi:hypothetical protein
LTHRFILYTRPQTREIYDLSTENSASCQERRPVSSSALNPRAEINIINLVDILVRLAYISAVTSRAFRSLQK